MPVKVVTDSTSDLPPELAESLGITVVPLNIHFGSEVYKDGVGPVGRRFSTNASPTDRCSPRRLSRPSAISRRSTGVSARRPTPSYRYISPLG